MAKMWLTVGGKGGPWAADCVSGPTAQKGGLRPGRHGLGWGPRLGGGQCGQGRPGEHGLLSLNEDDAPLIVGSRVDETGYTVGSPSQSMSSPLSIWETTHSGWKAWSWERTQGPRLLRPTSTLAPKRATQQGLPRDAPH